MVISTKYAAGSGDYYADCAWRVGTHIGRNLYAQTSPEPAETDVYLGNVETDELAALIVSEHNADLKAKRGLR